MDLNSILHEKYELSEALILDLHATARWYVSEFLLDPTLPAILPILFLLIAFVLLLLYSDQGRDVDTVRRRWLLVQPTSFCSLLFVHLSGDSLWATVLEVRE